MPAVPDRRDDGAGKGPAPTSPAKASVPKTEAAKIAPKAESVRDDLFSNTPMWAIAGGALALLGGGAC